MSVLLGSLFGVAFKGSQRPPLFGVPAFADKRHILAEMRSLQAAPACFQAFAV